MTGNTHYQAILYALAEKFFNETPEQQKPKREKYVSALQTDWCKFIAPIATDPPWKLWLQVQQGRVKMGFRERMNDPHKKMSADELSFLADSALYEHTGSHAIWLTGETIFGHEHKETIVSMLALHKEVSDRDNRKFKQTEQVWTNIAVRILLLAAHKQWFLSGETNIRADASVLSYGNAHHGAFFCQKGTQEKKICIRPEYHPAHPFRVESE